MRSRPALHGHIGAFCWSMLVGGCGASTAPSDGGADVRSTSDSATSEAAVDASAAPDATVADGGDAPSCDARRVLCNGIAPQCARGEAPSVVGGCWGPCVLATSCACTSNEECPDVRGFSEVCHQSRMRCGPLL